MLPYIFIDRATKSTVHQEGGSISNDELSTYDIFVNFTHCPRPENRPSNDAFLTRCIFQLVLIYIVWYLTTKSTVCHEGGGSKLNDALSTNSWRIITVVSWRIET